MRAMIVKEFRQLRRDRRTLAMMVVMPVLLLVVLGYAASFDVSTVPTVVAGPGAAQVAKALPAAFHLVGTGPASASFATWAQDQLRDGHAAVAVITAPRPRVLIDGSQLFDAQKALQELSALRGGTATTAAGATGAALPAAASVQILYNPELKTSFIMIPGLAGVILVFIGTIITSLGVVRERQSGTLRSRTRRGGCRCGRATSTSARSSRTSWWPPSTWRSCSRWASRCSECRSAARRRCSGLVP